MAYAHCSETQLSTNQLGLLGYLNQKWPLSMTVTPKATAKTGAAMDRGEFVDMVQTLSDNGLISYEAFLIEATVGARFLETLITQRGKAALHAAEVHA
jgi:hypothetical protein